MQKFNTIGDAIALAEFAHRNQVDKAGLPYIDHPRRVLEKVKAQGALPYIQMAAILHDVTEDTAFSSQMLLDLGVPESAVEIVRLVDRNFSKTRWIERRSRHLEVHSPEEYYYGCIKKDSGARMVKLADIEDNLSPWRLAYLTDTTQARLKDKYARAIALLT